MWDHIKSLGNFLKLKPRHLFVIAVVSATLLFSKREMLDRLGLGEFTENHRPIIGIVFLLSAAIYAIEVIGLAFPYLGFRWRFSNIKREIRKHLKALTEDEKNVLRLYVLQKTRTQYFALTDGVIHGLVANRILCRMGGVGSPGGWAYNITDYAWEYINENKHLLKSQ